MTDYTKMSASELKAACKAKQLHVSGNKALLISRLEAKAREDAQNAASPSLPPAPGAKDAKKLSGTGLRAVSPVRNIATSATGQAALNAVLLPMSDWADCHPDAISCVASLYVAYEILQPEDDEDEPDETVGLALEPVIRFCNALRRYTYRSVRDATLSSHFGHEYVYLCNFMSERIEEIVTDHPNCLSNPDILKLFRTLHSTPNNMPGPSYNKLNSPKYQERQTRVEEEQLETDWSVYDMQAALAASLQDVKDNARQAVDDLQLEMQKAYVASGGTLKARKDDNEGDDEEEGESESESESDDDVPAGTGLGEVPTFTALLSLIPKEGITFQKLAKKCNIQNRNRGFLEDFAEQVIGYTEKRGNKYFVLPPDPMFPSDQTVRQVVLQNLKMTMETLFTRLDLHKLGPDKCERFASGVFGRRVVVERDDGTLRVPQEDVPSTAQKAGSIAQTPELVRHPKSQSAGASAFAKMPTFVTSAAMVGVNTDPGKFGSSEHRPAPVPATPVVDTPTPAANASSSIASVSLTAEMIRIHAAVLAHLREWRSNFPRPTESVWADLTGAERMKIQKHVAAYIQLNALVGDKESIPASAQYLVNDATFPVDIAKNLGAITSCLNVLYGKEATKKKKAASTAGSATPHPRDEDEDEAEAEAEADDIVEDETLGTSGKTRKAGATTGGKPGDPRSKKDKTASITVPTTDTASTAGEIVATGTKRRRSARNTARAEDATSDAVEEEEATEPVQQKRRLIRKKKIVVESDGEDEDQ
jgi:hypothetical protein